MMKYNQCHHARTLLPPTTNLLHHTCSMGDTLLLFHSIYVYIFSEVSNTSGVIIRHLESGGKLTGKIQHRNKSYNILLTISVLYVRIYIYVSCFVAYVCRSKVYVCMLVTPGQPYITPTLPGSSPASVVAFYRAPLSAIGMVTLPLWPSSSSASIIHHFSSSYSSSVLRTASGCRRRTMPVQVKEEEACLDHILFLTQWDNSVPFSFWVMDVFDFASIFGLNYLLIYL